MILIYEFFFKNFLLLDDYFLDLDVLVVVVRVIAGCVRCIIVVIILFIIFNFAEIAFFFFFLFIVVVLWWLAQNLIKVGESLHDFLHLHVIGAILFVVFWFAGGAPSKCLFIIFSRCFIFSINISSPFLAEIV
jgi:hypothetical protein